ncbi:hypothetical protein ACI6QG_00730 [Roseococcus sp. DSY-14]|uniref:hypothetical protein n=1 Tax=Roseococcus sp. DSY-14 TaxID=3369650 RepID=UPI00387AFCA2
MQGPQQIAGVAPGWTSLRRLLSGLLAAAVLALSIGMALPALAAPSVHEAPCAADGHHAPPPADMPQGRLPCQGIACTAVMPALPAPVWRLVLPAVPAGIAPSPAAAPAGRDVPPALRPPQRAA